MKTRLRHSLYSSPYRFQKASEDTVFPSQQDHVCVFTVVSSLVVLIIAADIICGKAVGEFAISGLLGFVMSILFACASDKEGRVD